MQNFKNCHLFIVDTLEKLNLNLDTSLKMAHALAQKGARVFGCHPYHLFNSSINPEPIGQVFEFDFTSYPKSIEFKTQPSQICLSHFESIHLRINPPYDLKYITITWMLDFVKKSTVVFNAPSALRNINEKISILRWPQWITPTLLSSNPKHILDFVKEHHLDKIILKPLDLFGGQEIILMDTSDVDFSQKLENRTEKASAFKMIQAFNPKIKDGEVRAFTVGGKAVAWCLKLPAEGSILANTAAGATLHDYKPSAEEVLRVEVIAKELLKEGVHFIGMDLIGGQISEINITSPRLLNADPSQDRECYAKIAEYILSNTQDE